MVYHLISNFENQKVNTLRDQIARIIHLMRAQTAELFADARDAGKAARDAGKYGLTGSCGG